MRRLVAAFLAPTLFDDSQERRQVVALHTMWNRTKRLINSYLDDLIERVSGPGRDARAMTRAELARLNELEVQTRASSKILEKELAEVELKMLGLTERERQARDRGDVGSATVAGTQLVALGEQRDLIRRQLSEANASADRARALREERRRLGEDLATETHLTAMRENLSSIQTPFDATDPAGTLEEMRGRIKRSSGSFTDSRVAEADRELEAERARARVEDMLSRYKQGANIVDTPSPPQPSEPLAQTNIPGTNAPDANVDEGSPSQSKSLGRTDGPVRPID